jgi:hypothetical protein
MLLIQLALLILLDSQASFIPHTKFRDVSIIFVALIAFLQFYDVFIPQGLRWNEKNWNVCSFSPVIPTPYLPILTTPLC